ncbi:uncharacterized protein LOC133181676 [Saccostrea echinata]|uniref:uncharacterized protein LOC133181676 n=1 Tax=Saccostrea echinata TaxID=191078 RepID=UPI002A83BF2E|nr:uncharacterized protein LOC133181676 [Saccostrea echinata]
MEESHDVQELFFTNLQLLGFNVERKEAEVRIPFNKNMFDLPNRRGAEEVLYFLFSRLNPVMCKEEFRGCWPITDKQQEQMFRRGCNNWLSNINKEEPEAMLPRISPSLFLTPGGVKFYHLIYRFSRYVIVQVNEKENGAKDKEKHRYPTLTQKNKELANNMADTLISCVIRKRNTFLNTAQEIVSLNRQWKEQSNDMVKEYRKLNKEIRDTELKIRDEIHKSSQMSAARGSPLAKKQRSKSYEPDFDPKSTKRSQKVNEVRGLWKQLDGFLVSEASEREVIESVVDTSLTKYRIDSANISIKVPDLLLRECEKEIRRRHVDNTFHHGKLNLISLLQLWNLCLHLIQDRFQDTGVPDFTTDIENITTLAHKNHSLLVASQDLQREIEGVLPELKRSVDQLRSEVEQGLTTTPTQLRTSAVGLGLMEPTPEVSFSPASSVQGRQPTETSVTLTPHENATPEAVARISEDISVRVNRIKLFTDSPRISQSEKPASSTKVPRKLAMTQKSSTTRHLDRTKPRVVDVRGQLQSTPTKARRDQPVNAHIGLKALDLKQDLSLNDSDKLSADLSTLVQKEQSTLKLNVSTSRNTSTKSIPRENNSLNNFNNNEPFCDKTPTNNYILDVKVEQGGSMHRDMNKSETDVLVDEIFGETPKGSPFSIQKSPSDCLVEEVLSSGVLNSPFVDQSQDTDRNHFNEGELKSDIGENKQKVHIEKSMEELERGLSEINCSGDFTRTDKSAPYLQRPHSPVAEFLDHLEFEPTEKSQGILEKQVDALSDLESSRSSQGLEASDKENVPGPGLLASIDSLPEHQNSAVPSFDEEVDIDLRQEGISVHITPSAGIPIIKDSINIQESPLSEDIRKIYREAMGGEEFGKEGSKQSQSHPDIFDDFLCTADVHGDLDSVEMPVFSLNDSTDDIMEQGNQSNRSVNSGQYPSGSDNGQKLVKNMSPHVSDLNGNPVHHHPSRGVDRLIVDRQLSRTWEQLELSMEVLDDLMGKDHQFSPFLQSPKEGFFGQHKKSPFSDSPVCPKPKDNSSEGLDTSDDLDESFVPFKDGFSLEGGTTPAKKNVLINLDVNKDNGAEQSSTDDILARLEKLKQKKSQIVSDGT